MLFSTRNRRILVPTGIPLFLAGTSYTVQAAGASSSSGTGTGAMTTAAAASSSTAAPAFTLAATNPTAVPLSAINSNQPSVAQILYSITEAPGTVPTFISNAPPLPSGECTLDLRVFSIGQIIIAHHPDWYDILVATTLNAADYPLEDHVPPTDSPEVQQWIIDVNNTGVVIPNIPPTNPSKSTFLSLLARAPNNLCQNTNSCWVR